MATQAQAVAKLAVLPSENLAEYEDLFKSLKAEFLPETPAENFLVEEMARAQWKLRRVAAMEGELLTGAGSLAGWFKEDCSNDEVLLKLGRYEGNARRAWYKALTELQKLRANQSLLRRRAFEANLQAFLSAPVPNAQPQVETQADKAKPMPMHLADELARHKRRDPLFDPEKDRSQMTKELRRWFDRTSGAPVA